MTQPAFDADRYLDTVAPALGLTIDPAWRAGVLAHLTATAKAAGRVLDFPLDDEIEAAPVFEP